MVFARDDVAGRDVFVSYALCPLPNIPGAHHVDTATWYPAEPNKLNVRNLCGQCAGLPCAAQCLVLIPAVFSKQSQMSVDQPDFAPPTVAGPQRLVLTLNNQLMGTEQ